MTFSQLAIIYSGWAVALILAGWLVLVLSISASDREHHKFTYERLQAALAAIRAQEASAALLRRYESECA